MPPVGFIRVRTDSCGKVSSWFLGVGHMLPVSLPATDGEAAMTLRDTFACGQGLGGESILLCVLLCRMSFVVGSSVSLSLLLIEA